MALLLYTATAIALVAAAHRAIRPLSRSAAGLLLLLPFCFTAYALLTGRVLAPIDLTYGTEPLWPLRGRYGVGPGHAGILSDVAAQMLPWRKAVQWSLAHHQWPLWNPFILSGDILAAAAQPAAYSPFTLIACLLPVATSFNYTAAIAFFVAALGAFLFIRELGCGETAALVGAAAWMSCTNIAFFVLWPLGFAWAFLPAVLLGTRLVVRTPSLRAIAILATTLTLMLLAGHPETALHVVFVSSLYAVSEIASTRRDIARAVLAAIAAGVIAFLVCAIDLLPILEAVPQTDQHRYRLSVAATMPHGISARNILGRLTTDLLPFVHLTPWRVEGFDNLNVDTVAIGSIGLALAIYAIWRARTRDTWFFAGLAVFGLLARLEWKPVDTLLARLPGFDMTLNARLSFAAAFALSVLAAIGTEELIRRGRDLGAVITAFGVLVVITAGTLVVWRLRLVTENPNHFGMFAVFAEVAGVGCAAMVMMSGRRWTGAAIVALILLQRVMTVGGIYETFPRDAAYPPVPVFAALKNIGEPFRVTGVFLSFIPNMSALYELEDVRGYEAMTLALNKETWRLWSVDQGTTFNRVDDLTRPFLSFLNVRFAIVPPSYAPPPGWRVFATAAGTRLIENTNVIPRAFVPRRVRFYNVAWEAVNEMTGETNFRERAWIQARGVGEIDNGSGEVTSIRARSYGYDIAADMQHDGWVVISESAWTGWRAYVDGRRLPPQIANAAFVAGH
ncbi:MAG TPA: hypothetical protein VLU46_16790, partial [Thermoanaerobaculia bacterium]|nr:hypothetical protein [Thermoanaerobaculia bacterium]